MFDFDLFVIGGGSGGVRAARVASEKGFKVGLAEEYRLGGTCVIRGCVPKKLMVFAADFGDFFADAEGFGWDVGTSTFGFERFQAMKDKEIDRLESIYRSLLDNANVNFFPSRATLKDPHTIKLDDGKTYKSRIILIATGGSPFVPDFEGSDLVSTSNDVFKLQELPERVLICGGGYIACEFAGIFNGMGSSVTQVYRGPQILRGFDNDIREHLSDSMAYRGIDIRLNHTVEKIVRGDGGLRVYFQDGNSQEFDFILYATGRKPNTNGLNLENLHVQRDSSGAVVVDEYSQTVIPSIYAIGDATNRLNLTPVAIREAMCFVATVFEGEPTPVDHINVPTAVFTRPEIGTVGYSEEMARKEFDVEIYRTKFKSMLNAIANRDEMNLMKLVVDKVTRGVLGVHLICSGAAEMIQMVGIAVKMGATKEDFDRTCAVHPTAAEELVTLHNPIHSS